MLGCPGASDVLERLFIPGAEFMAAAGATVGGDHVSCNVTEKAEDDLVVGVVDSTVYDTIVPDIAAGTLAVGGVVHAAGVSEVVKKAGVSIAVSISNVGSVTVISVDTVTAIDIGVEATIGLLCTKVGIVYKTASNTSLIGVTTCIGKAAENSTANTCFTNAKSCVCTTCTTG